MPLRASGRSVGLPDAVFWGKVLGCGNCVEIFVIFVQVPTLALVLAGDRILVDSKAVARF